MPRKYDNEDIEESDGELEKTEEQEINEEKVADIKPEPKKKNLKVRLN